MCMFLNIKSNLQVIELPIKHPELFESLGIAQPKVITTRNVTMLQPLLVVFHHMLILLNISLSPCTSNRVSCYMDRLVQGRHCWLEQWLTTQIVLSSGFRGLNWSRNILEKVLEWSESFSSWPGLF